MTKQGDTVYIPCAAQPVQIENDRVVQEEWFRTRGKHVTDMKLSSVYCGSWLIGLFPSLAARSQDAAALPLSLIHI